MSSNWDGKKLLAYGGLAGGLALAAATELDMVRT